MSYFKWVVAIFTLVALAVPAFAVEDNLTIVGGDETTIREFLQIFMRDTAPPDTETTIYIGQLPDELGVDVPMPEGNIVGAIVREGSYSVTELILTSSQSVEVVSTDFETAMEAIGWERLGMNYGQRGFIIEETAYGDYCNDDVDNKFVNINMRQIEDETQIRIGINQSDPYMCNQGNMEEMQNQDPYLRLPKLVAPEGVTMLIHRGGGGGGGGYPGSLYATNSTWLESEDLSIAELMSAYDAQLVDNGWEMISTETGEHTTLSLWTFEYNDNTWNGYFTLMENATEDGMYYATIMVEQVSE